MNRIFCLWANGYSVLSTDVDFQLLLDKFTAEFGPPSTVEFIPAVECRCNAATADNEINYCPTCG